jgi:hypothetical protein
MKTLYYIPRIVSLGFVLFLSAFSLDVFSEYSGMQAIVPFLIHLLPALVLLLLILLAWKYDIAGVAIFVIVAVGYVALAGLSRPWSWYAFISGPALLIALLFFIHWILQRKK